jgi:hypothetical protein
MATTTPNFGWPVPTSTDLVKDGATAIEALGDSIDASLLDLKGGTSGQVLAKNSNTDMDFVWVAQDDSNAIQNTIVDAKGDLIAATAADTPARLAVGTNGQVLTADSTAATGLKWAAASAGALILVNASTVSATQTTNIDNVFTTAYRNYFIEIDGVRSNNDYSGIKLRAGGTTTTSYASTFLRWTSTPAVTIIGTLGSMILGGNGTAAYLGEITLFAPNVATKTKAYGTISGKDSTTTDETRTSTAYENSNTQFDGLQFTCDSGTFTGEIRIYGLKDA